MFSNSECLVCISFKPYKKVIFSSVQRKLCTKNDRFRESQKKNQKLIHCDHTCQNPFSWCSLQYVTDNCRRGGVKEDQGVTPPPSPFCLRLYWLTGGGRGRRLTDAWQDAPSLHPPRDAPCVMTPGRLTSALRGAGGAARQPGCSLCNASDAAGSEAVDGWLILLTNRGVFCLTCARPDCVLSASGYNADCKWVECGVIEPVWASVAYPSAAQTVWSLRRLHSGFFFSSPAPLFKLVSSISGDKPMRVCFREEFRSHLLLRRVGLIQQPVSCGINNGGSGAVPASAAAAGRGEGRAHRWCWDGSARHQHAAQQRLQRKRRALQEIQVFVFLTLLSSVSMLQS